MADTTDILFQPLRIGPVTAPNRFYAVPHATGHGVGAPLGAHGLRAMKAEGGWGTVAVQITEVAPDSDLGSHPIERIWDDAYLAGHAHQVEGIKRHGSLAAIELGHGGMRSRNFITGLPVPGPSDLPILRAEVPVQARAMDKSDIRAFRAAHKAAARRARAAGYDIIYAYAAHDISLLSNFLSRRTNLRTDEYGGPLENRVRLLREVLEDLHEVAAGDCAVALRFSVHEFGVAHPLEADGEGREVVEMLADLPDLWDVNVSGWPHDSKPARFAGEGFQLAFTDFVKQVTGRPVVGVGRFTSPETMRALIRDGRLDLIGAARPSIADPFLPRKVAEGREDEIRECIGCNHCVSMDGYGVPIRCTQNPTISEEWRRGWHPEIVPQADRPGHTLIVGAGPAGLEAALTLIRGGQTVTLADAADAPGGRARLESALAGLGTWARVAEHRMHHLSPRAAADLYLQSPMTAAEIADFGADHVLLATGADWRGDGVGSSWFDPVDWPGGLTVLTPGDILGGARPGGAVTVWDDEHHYMATVIAETLAEAGAQVTYATPMPTVAPWTEYTLEQRFVVARLAELGVRVHLNAALEAVTEGTLVMVGARLPRLDLARALDAAGVGYTRIGDCDVPGTIQAAVYSGHKAARELLAGGPLPFRLDRPRIPGADG